MPSLSSTSYDWDLRVRRLHRFPLGTSYRDLIGLIEHEMGHRALPRDTPLVIDASGVGEVMVDLFKGSAFPMVLVTITGGERASLANGRWHVPRRLLAETLAVLIEQEKLGVVADLPYARTLLEELASFDAEIRPTARVSFRPRGEQQHDDLVMALALACWYFRKLNPPSASPQTFSRHSTDSSGAGRRCVSRGAPGGSFFEIKGDVRTARTSRPSAPSWNDCFRTVLQRRAVAAIAPGTTR